MGADTSGAGPGGSAADGAEAGSGEGHVTAGVDLEAVTRAVHARLAGAARDCYPPAARRFRQTGRVPLRFCVDAALAPAQLVVMPSGLAVLDEAARGCVVPRAAPFPPEAAGRCFEVSVDFGP